MSIVIIGGHERMETQYKQICKQYKCKAKVFTKMKTDLKKKFEDTDWTARSDYIIYVDRST